MATIRKRPSGAWQARVIRKGEPTTTKALPSKPLAQTVG